MLMLKLVTCVAVAMLIHELGHLVFARRFGVSASELGFGIGPKLFGVQLGSIRLNLRALPLGSFVRLDGTALEARSIRQQLLVHLGGIILNIAFGLAAYDTIFGWANLLLAAGNLLPVYAHDGWKCGVVLLRASLRRKSQPGEWAFTLSGGFASLAIAAVVIRLLV